MKNKSTKDLIGTVTLLSGDQVDVYMPEMGDLLDAWGSNKTPIEAMVESAVGMSFSDFRKLSVIDGTRILTMLSNAIEAINSYTTSVQQKKH